VRKEIVSFLERVGVETRPILTGNILSQPAYSEISHRVVGELKQTQLILNRGFIVGVHPGLSDEDVNYVNAQFESFFQNLRK
jgi:CDP-6-deoxy-D-xylo-4-hexulose-3-dehydrase